MLISGACKDLLLLILRFEQTPNLMYYTLAPIDINDSSDCVIC